MSFVNLIVKYVSLHHLKIHVLMIHVMHVFNSKTIKKQLLSVSCILCLFPYFEIIGKVNETLFLWCNVCTFLILHLFIFNAYVMIRQNRETLWIFMSHVLLECVKYMSFENNSKVSLECSILFEFSWLRRQGKRKSHNLWIGEITKWNDDS